jgi:hypothetical protein
MRFDTLKFTEQDKHEGAVKPRLDGKVNQRLDYRYYYCIIYGTARLNERCSS